MSKNKLTTKLDFDTSSKLKEPKRKQHLIIVEPWKLERKSPKWMSINDC